MEQREHDNTGEWSNASVFSAGAVLSRTFSTMCGNLIVFFALAVIASLPSFVADLVLPPTRGSAVAQVLLSVVCNQLILGAVSYAAYRVLMGDSASIGGSLAHGMSRLASLVGAALLVGLSGGIIMVLARITGPIIGLVLLVVLAMLMCMWSVVVPACVVERLGPVESLNRSMELTRDCRLKIFGLTLLVGIASRLIERAAGSVAGSTASGSILLSLVLLFVYAIPQTFGNVMPAIIYYDLRAAKEGVTLESLADVFD